MSSSQSRNSPPRATALIEALRGLGYTSGAAIADIIDNSVSAGARTVWIDVEWNNGNGRVTILDDGSGMADQELELAMTLGDKNPLDRRSESDLGRFGLGLKTASFSQGRRLTVASKKDRTVSILRWDLDYLLTSADGGWHLLEGLDPRTPNLIEKLDEVVSGTLVILELLDRMMPNGGTTQDLLDLLDRIEKHLSMVFHRFIEKSRLTIYLNKQPIKPWDPFLSSHPATWSSPRTKLDKRNNGAWVQAFVLPHRDRLKPKEYEAAAGPDGWNSHQGFFVYRNERMILSGGWLSLGKGRHWTREEPYRLARIELEIPNSADADWKIDIRKSTAYPPPIARATLTHIAEDARERARRVFAFRGRPSTGNQNRDPVLPVWEAIQVRAGIRYRISSEHPAIASVLDIAGKIDGTLQKDIRTMLRVLEETIPVQRIWLDTAENKDTPRSSFDGEPPEEVLSVAQTIFNSMLKRKGMSPELARASLLRTEPFDQYPELIASLKEES